MTLDKPAQPVFDHFVEHSCLALVLVEDMCEGVGVSCLAEVPGVGVLWGRVAHQATVALHGVQGLGSFCWFQAQEDAEVGTGGFLARLFILLVEHGRQVGTVLGTRPHPGVGDAGVPRMQEGTHISLGRAALVLYGGGLIPIGRHFPTTKNEHEFQSLNLNHF